jgi:hypothetical protein
MRIRINPTAQILAERGLQRGGRVQTYIDNEVVRLSSKYVPMRTGTLKKAIGTVFGSGKVIYGTPYARKNYYENAGRGTNGTASGGLRGRMWFERMKSVYLERILNGARRVMRGR